MEPLSNKEVEEVIRWKRININVVSPNTVETWKGQKKPYLQINKIDLAIEWFELFSLEKKMYNYSKNPKGLTPTGQLGIHILKYI